MHQVLETRALPCSWCQRPAPANAVQSTPLMLRFLLPPPCSSASSHPFAKIQPPRASAPGERPDHRRRARRHPPQPTAQAESVGVSSEEGPEQRNRRANGGREEADGDCGGKAGVCSVCFACAYFCNNFTAYSMSRDPLASFSTLILCCSGRKYRRLPKPRLPKSRCQTKKTQTPSISILNNSQDDEQSHRQAGSTCS
jgi:hypothetical protein